jgi:hypothetical protein
VSLLNRGLQHLDRIGKHWPAVRRWFARLSPRRLAARIVTQIAAGVLRILNEAVAFTVPRTAH